MTLANVLGQDRVIHSLRSILTHAAMHHAYLFAGPDGVGKELTAISFVEALLCADKPNEGCGQCSICSRLIRRGHPDITWVMPEEELVTRGLAGRADFAGTPSREIRVEQIRQLQERFALRPLEAGYKVAIVASAQQMNIQAQNALLKTLEEPPGDALLILVTSSPDRLLPTIRSRCAKVLFAPLSETLIAERIRKERNLEPGTAELVARLSSGSLGRALKLDVKELERRRELIQAFEGMGEGIGSALEFAETFAATRAEAEGALAILRLWVRDLLAVKAQAGPVLNRDLEELARDSSARRSELWLLHLHTLIERAHEAISDRNGAPRLQMERMLIEIRAAA